MCDIEDKKQDRSKLKRAVTVTARQLIGAIHRGVDIDELKHLMLKLDQTYDDFCVISEEYEAHVSTEEFSEYRVVNGEDLVTYKNRVRHTYDEAANSYSKQRYVSEQIAKAVAGGPIKAALSRDIIQVKELVHIIDSSISMQCKDWETMGMDRDELNSMLDTITDNMNKLSTVGSTDQINTMQGDVDAIVGMVFNRKREINKQLRMRETPPVSKTLPAEVKPSPPLDTGVTLPQVATLPQLPRTQFTGLATGNPHVTQPAALGISPSLYDHKTNIAVHGGLLSAPMGGASTSQVSTQPYVSIETRQDSTFSHDMSIPPVDSVPQYHMPPPSGYPGVMQPNSNFGSTYTMNPAWPPAYYPWGMGQAPAKSDIHLKKLTLPTFSGFRKDWPEFKAVWKQLAETTYKNKTALAHELKRSVKGEAFLRVKSVYVTKPEAYEIMWRKLEAHYEDTSAGVQSALDELHKLKAVKKEDYRGLVEFVDEVESVYSQLEELNQLNTLTMRDVDTVNDLLPSHLKVEWIRKYHDMTPDDKINPFPLFMRFLSKEREVVARLAESQPTKKKDSGGGYQDNGRVRGQVHQIDNKGQDTPFSSRKYYPCAYTAHRKDNVKHITEECKEFCKLPVNGKSGRYELLKQVNACFICFGDHRKQKCPNKRACSKCGREDHHELLCKSGTSNDDAATSSNYVRIETSSNVSQTTSLALYPIQQANVFGSNKSVSLFCDSGSNTTYITHQAARRIGAKRMSRITLDITTMGNVEKTYDTHQYQFSLKTYAGKKVTITAFGMEKITGPVSELDQAALSKLFPDYDPESLQRKFSHVDILLGCDYFGLHPKHEEAKCGEHLSIMRGEFGVCIQGSHPELVEATRYDSNLAKTIHESEVKTASYHIRLDSHPEFQPENIDPNVHSKCTVNFARSVTNKCMESQVENFIRGEELATETTPRCGGCRCSKCPTVGHTYSFKEEQELQLIRENLEYDEVSQHWVTSYPWIVDPSTLPDNRNIALATLKSTERVLSKDEQWAKVYKQQMQDMFDRGVARKLSMQESQEWDGPKFYISHLAVVNPRSHSTPVRIVFNSSQVCERVSLNSCLAKGPDCYINNLLGILLRWREEHIALVGDIRKMFNSVFLKPLEQHCHRFLWRDLISHKNPDEFVMTRVNMGDTPAPAISTEAIYKTADLFKNDSPRAAELLKKSSYVDDLIDSFPSMNEALEVARDTQKMLGKGGFTVKCWQFSGESAARTGEEMFKNDSISDQNIQSNRSMLKGTGENQRVLGLGWRPVDDIVVFEVSLNFSKKKKGVHTGPNLKETDVPKGLPTILTRRIVLAQMMKIYDPLGLVCPFTLLGKIYLRKTWSRNLGWDDQLPDDLHTNWIHFFGTLFQLEELHLSRCLQPPDTVGYPWLVILSDGSDLAYGFVAYIRWQLQNGSYWCRLIMAKSRIAPMNKLSTPQMELNAAVLSKRGRKVIEKEMRFNFERVLQIVDSATVLSMINKTSTRFKVYEGVRIGEIQAATNGDVSCWAWMSGKDNTADWLTRGRTPAELNSESDWWNGPPILYRPIEEWRLKFGIQGGESLPGEKMKCNTAVTEATPPLIDYKRFSAIRKVVWVVARLQNIAKKKSFCGGQTSLIAAQHLQDAENFIVKDVQRLIHADLENSSGKSKKGGKFARLTPVLNKDGLWVVGERLMRHNAMSPDSSLQTLLPTRHHVTRLIMERAHQAGHRGRDATLARFRQYYWTPHGSKLASSVKHNCQMCKLHEAKLLKQEMGLLPVSRLKPSPAFNHVMLDLFGPYTVRGEVQKRTSGKAYGVIFTDLAMRAVHIEAVFGYDTSSFLMAMSRFASIRGWPATVNSDPGSQLIGAERELKEAWQKIDKEALQKNGADKGLTWKFGPADSPWHQGAVESLVKSAKRSIHFAVSNRRLSVPEFLTVCTEVSNLLNERPIGALPSFGSSLNILTPNSLLLGRATAVNPRGWQPYSSNITNRYHLVQAVTDEFWKRWIELYAPTLVVRSKWNTPTRNLCPGDVVIIADKNTLRGEYRLGLVKEVFPGEDGKVRRVTVIYKNYRVGEKFIEYRGAKDVTVSRSIQRLSLLVPVDYVAEQCELESEIRNKEHSVKK